MADPKTEAEILRDFRREGWTIAARRPETVTVMVEDFTTPEGKRPQEMPTGNTVWGITNPATGQYDEVVVKPNTEPYVEGQRWTTGPVYDPVRGPKEEVKTPSESTQAAPELAEQRRQEAAAAAALAQSRQSEEAQRQANKQATGYAVTDQELARLRSDAASQNLTAQQLDLRAREMEQTAGARGRELDIASANQRIAAANQALAERRLQLDDAVRSQQMTLDQAKFEYLKAKDATDQQTTQDRLQLERFAQEQKNLIEQQQLGLSRETLEQRKAEAEQRRQEALQTQQTAAQQTAATAAGTILTQERQAQAAGAQTGAGLLNQRVQAAQGMLNTVLGLAGQGQRSGNMGGGMMAVPAGLGEQLVRGIQGWTTELGGGQPIYDTAARMVQQADPQNGMSPMGQAAYGVLSQMLEKYRQVTGEDHPAVAATTAAQGSINANGFVAPGQLANRAAAGQQLTAATSQFGAPFGAGGIGANPMAAAMPQPQPVAPPTTMPFGAISANPMAAAMQSQTPQFKAPTTITINA